jgi:hypothetical protein
MQDNNRRLEMSTQPKDSPFIRYCLNLSLANLSFECNGAWLAEARDTVMCSLPNSAHALACSAAFQVYSLEYAKFMEATRDA